MFPRKRYREGSLISSREGSFIENKIHEAFHVPLGDREVSHSALTDRGHRSFPFFICYEKVGGRGGGGMGSLISDCETEGHRGDL